MVTDKKSVLLILVAALCNYQKQSVISLWRDAVGAARHYVTVCASWNDTLRVMHTGAAVVAVW